MMVPFERLRPDDLSSSQDSGLNSLAEPAVLDEVVESGAKLLLYYYSTSHSLAEPAVLGEVVESGASPL